MNDQEIEDGVFVPRGLLGSARYAILHKCDAPNTYAKLGEYVYPKGNTVDVDTLIAADESIRVLTVDRDIKAANLKTLVDMVLDYADLAEQFVDGPPYDDAGKKADELWTGVIDLARGLKQ